MSSAEDHNARGNAAFMAGEFHEALRHYFVAVEIEPTAKYYSNRSAAFRRLGSTKQAYLDGVTAHVMEPTSPKFFSRMLAPLRDIGDWDMVAFLKWCVVRVHPRMLGPSYTVPPEGTTDQPPELVKDDISDSSKWRGRLAEFATNLEGALSSPRVEPMLKMRLLADAFLVAVTRGRVAGPPSAAGFFVFVTVADRELNVFMRPRRDVNASIDDDPVLDQRLVLSTYGTGFSVLTEHALEHLVVPGRTAACVEPFWRHVAGDACRLETLEALAARLLRVPLLPHEASLARFVPIKSDAFSALPAAALIDSAAYRGATTPLLEVLLKKFAAHYQRFVVDGRDDMARQLIGSVTSCLVRFVFHGVVGALDGIALSPHIRWREPAHGFLWYVQFSLDVVDAVYDRWLLIMSMHRVLANVELVAAMFDFFVEHATILDDMSSASAEPGPHTRRFFELWRTIVGTAGVRSILELITAPTRGVMAPCYFTPHLEYLLANDFAN